MAIRTYYWHERVVTRWQMARQRLLGRDTTQLFRVGNVGDIFNRDLIRQVYDTEARNIANDGRRLLLIGSIAHQLRHGDVVCGIGTKGERIPDAREADCHIVALRGPLTQAAFAAAGHNVRQISSLLDPGLMIRFSMADSPAVRGRVSFIPHYRERHIFRRRLPRGLSLIDVDRSPTDVAKQILASELIYTSSLHGLIFAHALRRPCVLVQPQTTEPDFKYRDYFASVGLPWRRPLTVAEALRGPSPDSPLDLKYTQQDFAFPDMGDLKARGIAE